MVKVVAGTMVRAPRALSCIPEVHSSKAADTAPAAGVAIRRPIQYTTRAETAVSRTLSQMTHASFTPVSNWTGASRTDCMGGV